MKPKVSVCITTYNHEKYISQAIDSVLMQKTDFEFEILVGEDDSSDSTRAIVKGYSEKHPDKIRLFLNDRENVIFIDGRPTGRWNFINNIHRARGDYIALLDGDDYWTDELKLQKQINFLDSNHNYSGCFHDTLIQESAEEKLWRVYAKNDFTLVDTFSTVALFHANSFVFKNYDLSLPDWFTKVVSADMALFSIVAARGNLKRLGEVMSVYRKHDGGITACENLISNYHKDRVVLMRCLNKHFGYKYSREIGEVIEFHEGQNRFENLSDESVLSKLKKFVCSLRSLSS